MRIVLFMEHPAIPSGYANACRITAKELIKRGHEVWAVGLNSAPEPEIKDYFGIPVIPNYALTRNPKALYGDLEAVIKIYSDISPDIFVFLNDSYRYEYLTALPQEIANISIFWLPYEGVFPDAIGLGIFNRLAATRFLTTYGLDLHRNILTGKNIGVIPHAIDLVEFKPTENKAQAKTDHLGPRMKRVGNNYEPCNTFVITRVDRHQPRKWWETSLIAFSKFAKDKPDVFFLCKCNPQDQAGEGNLQILVDSLGVKDKVSFDDYFFTEGFKSDEFISQSFYAPADVFLTTTSGEGFGLTPVQAMACSIPVIAPEVPALPEVLGQGAIFCRAKEKRKHKTLNVEHNITDIDDVVQKLQWAYEDWKSGSKQLSLIGQRGRKIVEEKYSIQAVYDQWERLFEDITKKQELINGGVETRRKTKVVFNAKLDDSEYGMIAQGLIPELSALGFDVYINDCDEGKNITNPCIRELIEKTRLLKEAGFEFRQAVNIICGPAETFFSIEADYRVGVVVAKNTKIHSSKAQVCSALDRILTISKFEKNVLLDSGVKIPINTIMPGVSSSYIRQKKDKFTFTYDDDADTESIIKLFCETFPKDRIVPIGRSPLFPVKCNQTELVIRAKSDPKGLEEYAKKANVRISTEPIQGDCFIAKSGLAAIDSIAAGTPVIYIDWGTPSEYLTHKLASPCILSSEKPFISCEEGQTANICKARLKDLMLSCIQDKEKIEGKAKKDSDEIRAKYSWKESAKKLIPVLFEYEQERVRKEHSGEFNPSTFIKPKLAPINHGDRIMIDVVTRDRNEYLATLLMSLLAQTMPCWDLTIQIDDINPDILNNHQIASLLQKCKNEGHGVRLIAGSRRGPHVAHDKTLRITAASIDAEYKVICRIDDDIIIQPDYLEKIYTLFLEDKDCQIAAVGGVYLNPKASIYEQAAPQGFENLLDYAGKIDCLTIWPFTCSYPETTLPRAVEHLHSSFAYRTEVGVSIGGYCLQFSQIGHREETDFTYRLFLAGYKLMLHPHAVGYHFAAPSGGIRSKDIPLKDRLARIDHNIYLRRIALWKKQAQQSIAGKIQEKNVKLLAIVNCGDNLSIAQKGIEHAAKWAEDIYATSPNKDAAAILKNEKLRMVACSTQEVMTIVQSVISSGDHTHIMTVQDTMEFLSDPRPSLRDGIDDFVFETYYTYKVNTPGSTMIGPETRNECLVSKKNASRVPAFEKTFYADPIVINHLNIVSATGLSLYNQKLIPIGQMNKIKWTKFCLFQYPEGILNPPKHMEVEPQEFSGTSIILPTHNNIDSLKKCLASIYTHTSSPFELIVIDCGSTDGTKEFLQLEKRPGLSVIQSEFDLGYLKAIQLGLKKAKGDYIAIIKDSIWFEGRQSDGKDWIETYIQELQDNSVGIVGPLVAQGEGLNTPVAAFACCLFRKTVLKAIDIDDHTFYGVCAEEDFSFRIQKTGLSVRKKLVSIRRNPVQEKATPEELSQLRAKHKQEAVANPPK